MAESIWELSLERFRDQVAGDTPTPGGGAVAAVTAAFAAALLRMVCTIALRHAQRVNRGDIEAIAEKVKTCEATLALYAGEDIHAFDAYMQARRKGPPDVSHALLLECAGVPMAGAETVSQLQSFVAQIEAVCPAFARSDLDTAVYLLRASRESLLANVKINLDALSAGAKKQELQARFDRLTIGK